MRDKPQHPFRTEDNMQVTCAVLVPKLPTLKRKRQIRDFGESIFKLYAIERGECNKPSIDWDYDYIYSIGVENVDELDKAVYDVWFKIYEGIKGNRFGEVNILSQYTEPGFTLKAILPDVLTLSCYFHFTEEEKDYLRQYVRDIEITPELIGRYYVVFVDYHVKWRAGWREITKASQAWAVFFPAHVPIIIPVFSTFLQEFQGK